MATLDELQSRQTEIKGRLQEIDTAAAGARFTEDQTAEWNSLNTEFDENRQHIEELEARARVIEDRLRAGSTETEEKTTYARGVKKSRVPDDPTDLAAYRNTAGSFDELNRAYTEGAKKLVERISGANEEMDREATQARVERLLDHVDDKDNPTLARRIIATSSKEYERGFAKYIAGQHRSPEEERALSLSSGSGGYAVPVVLDPTLILTSAGRINPVRNIARVETIVGNTWYGVSSTGLSAAYGAEATEASDNAPTLVQPSLNVEKAQAFVPFSIEIGQDWGNLATEMSRLFGEAKEDLESTKFHSGLGHTSNEPQGLIAVGGATAVVTTATTAVFAVADLYSLEIALQPRARARAAFVGNKAAYQKIRQFDTGGGASLWVQLQAGYPGQLIGYDAYEWSAYSSATTTSGSTILTFGDFSKFLIVDRVGMDVEYIPHVFATANNRPSGTRALYAYWRNSSTVLTPGLSANSAFQSLKVL